MHDDEGTPPPPGRFSLARSPRVVYGLFVWDIVPTVATNVVGLLFSMYYCAVFAWAVEPASRKNSTYNLFAATFLLVW